MVSKGLFIVCEGMDGCGKTTQAHLLVNWIFSTYKSVDALLLTREPTKSKFGIELSKRLREMKTVDENKERLMELFILDRAHHVDNYIVPMLNQKAVIICDRYKYSTIVYQAVQGIPTARLIEDNADFPAPDVTLIFNTSVENCMQRLNARGITDRFENAEFLEKIKLGYAKLPSLFPKDKFVIINGNQSLEQVHKDVQSAIKPLLDAVSK